jgi:hypothetical protein
MDMDMDRAAKGNLQLAPNKTYGSPPTMFLTPIATIKITHMLPA